jgi:hypothetical protein
MHNYFYAFLLFVACLFALNCQRPAAAYGHQRVVLAGTASDTIVLTDKYYVGDTISFVYTDRPLIFDTLLYELAPTSAMSFIKHQVNNPPDELRFSRMDISEIESHTENVYILKAKKAGTAHFSVISRINADGDAKPMDSRTTWKLEILAR